MSIKKYLSIGLLSVAVVGLLSACGSSSASKDSSGKEKVTLATVGTTRPFSYEDDKGELTGYDIEVAKAIFKDSDKYDVSYQKTEWSSIFTGLDSDKFQIGANNISYTKERANKYLYSKPIASNPTVLVVPKGSTIKTYDDIAGHSTQVVQGTTSASQLEAFNEKHSDNPIKLNYTNENISTMLHHLNDGQYDFKIFDKIAVNSIIQSQGLDNLDVIDLPSDEQPYVYLIFGQDQKDLQAYADKRIQELYKDGTLEKLSQKYLEGSYLPNASDVE